MPVPLSSRLDRSDRADLTLSEPVRPLFPGGVLVRGWTVGCHGPAAVSLASALVAGAVGAGSWVAVVGIPTFGVESAAELGVDLTRVVAVAVPSGSPSDWAERVAAAMDGFDLVITTPPPRVPDRLARTVQQRCRARGAVLVVVAPTGVGSVSSAAGTVPTDARLSVSSVAWDGTSGGAGRLLRRKVTVTADGRRIPRPVVRELWLPALDGAPAATTGVTGVVHTPEHLGAGPVVRAASA